jgi:COP9 signalosome complex subunit 3
LLLQACVATRHFTAAIPVLAHSITTIDLSLSDLTYQDNLIYHYAGGIAFAALKNWPAAEELFEICASSPGSVASAIQMEALKKLALVQLIYRGKVRVCSMNTRLAHAF